MAECGVKRLNSPKNLGFDDEWLLYEVKNRLGWQENHIWPLQNQFPYVYLPPV